MKSNKQRAKEAAEKILNKLDAPHTPLWRQIIEGTILAALNAATEPVHQRHQTAVDYIHIQAARIKDLNDALGNAIEVIKQWHDMPGSQQNSLPDIEVEKMWKIYYNNAPEMASIRTAAAVIEGRDDGRRK